MVSSLSWMEQLSMISHFYLDYYSRILYSLSNSQWMKSRYQYLRQFPSIIRQWASPSYPIIAISEKRFPFEMGQFTVISSFGRDQAFSRIMQRLNPDQSRKQIFACLSKSYLYLAQNQQRFYSCFAVLRSFGTLLTLFFLNLPTWSNLATIVFVISSLSPSFRLFRSQILLSQMHSQFKVKNGFSLINRETCYNLSKVNLFQGVRLNKSSRIILSQKV